MDFHQVPTIREEIQLTATPYTISPVPPPSSDIHPVVSPELHATYSIPPYSIPPPIGHQLALPNDPGTPPSYEEAIASCGPPHPSYDSLFGRIRDFLKGIIVLLFGTVGFTIMFGIIAAIPISMMVIGGLYLYDCPQNEYIPVYLLVAGVFGVFKNLLDLCVKSSAQILMNIVLIGWFILGSIWVYREYEPNYDPLLGKYCNKTLYLFAFWLTTVSYILLGLFTVGVCSLSVAAITFQQFE